MSTRPLLRDPSKLLRYRDSIYASDLLVCAVAHLDFFTFLKDSSRTFDEICENFETASRPTDVMLSLFLAMELIEKVGIEYRLTDICPTKGSTGQQGLGHFERMRLTVSGCILQVLWKPLLPVTLGVGAKGNDQ